MTSLGFNTGFVEELYKKFLEEPESVSPSWRDFFTDYRPSASFVAVEEVASVPEPDVQEVEDHAPADADVRQIRGASARLVQNMEASLGMPTATSVRRVAVKLLAENRTLLNQHQQGAGGLKVSYTHLIGYAVVRALKAIPHMYSTFRRHRDEPEHILPHAINLGLAIDVERRGKRALLVPNIKGAGGMNFAQFIGIYNDLIRRARQNRLTVADFQGTTATLTNPGMIGTSLSVPRLMPNQGVIVGIGSIGYPAEFRALPPDAVSKVGISQVMTITSTYDHRIIQGAESGAFLAYLEELLLGKHNFYTDVFAHLNVPYAPYVLSPDSTPQLGTYREASAELDVIEKQARVMVLIRVFRVRGHLQADTNPLGYQWTYHPELDPAQYGLTVWDLDREFVTGGLGGKDVLPLREILRILRETYTRRIGVQFMHISDPTEKRWLQERIEPLRNMDVISVEGKRRIAQKLNSAEAFERFLHTKYIGHKRFSLEGGESLIPMIDVIISDAAEQEVHEVVIGMAHRGRLNVLANILEKSYEAIFSEFEGNLDPGTIYGSGDVKYHLGAKSTHTVPDGSSIALTLASNPSHLEAVSPIVEGMVRSKQDMLRRQDAPNVPGGDVHDAVLPLLIHGDAAFAGQGVVAETLNFSQLRGYHTGGTVHIVINNQIGFTTGPSEARSSQYATDVARLIEAPIFHVNGDDPEACVRIARLALDYRQVFNKDVVIDMLCYRVHGHNEGDEPTFTNPVLYQQIQAKRSPRKLYTEMLLQRGEMSPEETERVLDDFHGQLQEAFERTRNLKQKDPEEILLSLLSRMEDLRVPLQDVDTRATHEDIEAVLAALVRIPEHFAAHEKLVRQFARRDERFRKSGHVDWAFAEALSFGTLLTEGISVRLSGQDSRRATFSQRHAVLYDQVTNEEYIPLNNIREGQARFFIYDSLLSEYAVTGFEYGYSVGDPSALVIWEAQFGDFSNGAQIVFDQFLSAAEEKWGQTSSMVALLPHGYEGQGPEHSSARLERFLQLCAEDNMIVCYLSTPANYFHALRRQVKRELKKPLILMTPKSLLRHAQAVSDIKELTDGAFRHVICDDIDPNTAQRVLVCSGKIYYDLHKALQGEPEKAGRIAVARLEQLYPFPADYVEAALARYKGAHEVFWVQEEPENMGAWTYVRNRIDGLLEKIHGNGDQRVRYIGRVGSASPASGSAMVHQIEQWQIVQEALALAS